MLLKFTSIITNQGKDNKISFTAPVEISQWQHFRVFEFIEPSMQEQNRIEVAENEVNIFSGPNTLNLALGQKISIEYFVHGGGNVYFQTQLHELINGDNLIEISYSLFNKEILIGKYDIVLEIIKEA